MYPFKNFFIYNLSADHGLTVEGVQKALEAKPFVSLGAMDFKTEGFVAPAAHAPDLMAYPQNGAFLLCMRIDEKILPASVIRQATNERVTKMEADEDRRVGRKEAREIRDRIIEELLPRALTKTSHQRALIDLLNNRIMVEGSSSAKAELLLSVLRDVIGSLPTRLMDTKTSPQTGMTLWLSGEAPEGFMLDADCELQFPGEGGALARLTRQTLDADEVKKHLESGKLVCKMGMVWGERLGFVLTEQFGFRKVAFTDVVRDELDEMALDDRAALFDANMLMFLGDTREMLASLILALGGVAA